MTSVPVEPTTPAAMATAAPVAAARPAFASNASHSAAITTDFLALVGFAARLGTCVNNDANSATDGQDAKSVRDEAMLLMSLLMGKKAEEILSEEIGAKESRSENSKRKKNGLKNKKDCRDNMGNFSFTFPSLSLQPDTDVAVARTAAVDASTKAKTTGPVSCQEDRPGEVTQVQKVDENTPAPSQLLGRTQSVSDKDAIRDSSEAMAHNVLESFGAALEWRAKTWIKSLANVLALKEQERIDVLKQAGEEDCEEAGACQEDAPDGVVGAEAGGSPSPDADNNDDLMNSREMQIIGAIVKSSEEVSVVNVKTSFRVLSNPVSHQSSNDKEDQQEPLSKKSKTNEYKVTHKLVFEATISMTSNDGVRYNGIKLQAPGYIQGTFTRTRKSKASTTMEGEETLMGISMTLDTDALALSLERQSRLVVRRAAEAALMAASGIDCASRPIYMDSPHVHHSIISPRYVLMSPVRESYPRTNASVMPTFPPLQSVEALDGEEESENKASPSVVSASEGHSSDSSATTTRQALSPSFPALLSVAYDELSRGDQ